MREENQLTMIKGTRDGLTLFIDDSCAYQDALTELEEKLLAHRLKAEEPNVSVTVQLGNRYITEEQKKQLSNSIESKQQFIVKSFESNVVLKEEALAWKEQSEVKSVNRVIRSGQVLEVTGDLLLIGDVNPGGKVVSTGNIYIMGSLHGIAHSGSLGDRKAVIAASYMNPSQLRIADYISRAPDYESEGVYMECGFIDEDKNQITIERLQVLSTNRKDLSGFERRMLNG